MQSRTGIALIFIASVSGPGGGEAQTADCDPNTRACFDIRIDLPLASEPAERVGYERPTVNRYQAQEAEIYRQLRMDYTPYTCSAIGGEEGLSNRDDQQGTDVEHIVALAEAHDSGLKAEDMLTFSGESAEPHAGDAVRKPHGQERPRRRRFPTGAEPVLVRRTGHRGEAEMGTERRHARSAFPQDGVVRLHARTDRGAHMRSVKHDTDRKSPADPDVRQLRGDAVGRVVTWREPRRRDVRGRVGRRRTRDVHPNTARDRDKDGRACEA